MSLGGNSITCFSPCTCTKAAHCGSVGLGARFGNSYLAKHVVIRVKVQRGKLSWSAKPCVHHGSFLRIRGRFSANRHIKDGECDAGVRPGAELSYLKGGSSISCAKCGNVSKSACCAKYLYSLNAIASSVFECPRLGLPLPYMLPSSAATCSWCCRYIKKYRKSYCK